LRGQLQLGFEFSIRSQVGQQFFAGPLVREHLVLAAHRLRVITNRLAATEGSGD
jgi:hypothetical protein